MSFIPSIISGAAGLIGGAISGNASSNAQAAANAENLQLQKNQEQWETQMSNTSYQRGVKDLEAAGLNPLLAVNNGGASVPNVSAAQVQSTGGGAAGGIGSALPQSATSAMDAYMKVQQATQMQMQNAKIQADTNLTNAQAVSEGQRPGNISADTSVKTQSAVNLSQQSANLGVEYMKLYNEARNLSITGDQQSLSLEQSKALMPLVIRANALAVQEQSLGMPRLSNEAEAAKSWWGRNVMPYLPSVLQGAAVGGAAGAAFNGVRSLMQKGPSAPTFDMGLSQ